jgi:chromosome segregation ATPase
MCHKKLQVDFGPNLNFIIGHNGSTEQLVFPRNAFLRLNCVGGKSAIMTALTVCLGSTASQTNRASNLRSLIRSGEQ